MVARYGRLVEGHSDIKFSRLGLLGLGPKRDISPLGLLGIGSKRDISRLGLLGPGHSERIFSLRLLGPGSWIIARVPETRANLGLGPKNAARRPCLRDIWMVGQRPRRHQSMVGS